jgi:hypothetical protein
LLQQIKTWFESKIAKPKPGDCPGGHKNNPASFEVDYSKKSFLKKAKTQPDILWRLL